MFDFGAVIEATGSASDTNPWSDQIEIERESGLYLHPVDGRAISLGGAIKAALGNAGKLDIEVESKVGRKVVKRTVKYRDHVAAMLKVGGITLRTGRGFGKAGDQTALDAKIAVHEAIAAKAAGK